MNNLSVELRQYIASLLENPYPLACCSRNWYIIVHSSYTKYKWIINKYGCVHALFHAIRIGEPFLNLEVVTLILKNTHISRYVVQRLRHAHETSSPWVSKISNNVYEYIIHYKEKYASSNCDDMQLIRRLLKKTDSENDIRAIIETYGFVPLPPSFTFSTYILANYENDQSSDGYATVSELRIVAEAIITYPNLLNIWRRMGYNEIIADLENFVVQLTLLNLYSNEVPPVQTIAEKLCNLQSIGFSLTDTVIGNVLILFKQKLIRESLIEGFSIARKMCKTDVLVMCLINLLNPLRNLKQDDALNYIIESIDNPEMHILSAFRKYNIVEVEDGNNLAHTSLKYSLVIYRYMLRFGAKSPVVKYLIKEISIVRTQDANTIFDEYRTVILELFTSCTWSESSFDFSCGAILLSL